MTAHLWLGKHDLDPGFLDQVAQRPSNPDTNPNPNPDPNPIPDPNPNPILTPTLP